MLQEKFSVSYQSVESQENRLYDGDKHALGKGELVWKSP
jgi:hypothetical protein